MHRKAESRMNPLHSCTSPCFRNPSDRLTFLFRFVNVFFPAKLFDLKIMLFCKIKGIQALNLTEAINLAGCVHELKVNETSPQ